MEKPTRIYSFDIFDTLLSRDVANPQSIWVLVGTKLLDQEFSDLPVDLRIDFKAIRREAEKRCTQNTEGHEASLDGIYEEIGRAYPELAQARLEAIKKIEIELELKHIYGIPENIATVLGHLERGERVVLATDMYLPAKTIRELLRRAEPKLSELKIYLSSERKAGKSNGAMFDIICREEEVSHSQIQHCGDNVGADYSTPKSMGIHASLFTASRPTSYEACYSDKYFGLLPNVVAGISKRLRLSQAKPSKLYELGAGFTAPFFYGFVHALVNHQKPDRPDAFYFLARDGYVLRKMAQRICQMLGLERKLEYLYVSRQSVYLASIHRINAINLNQILEGCDDAPSIKNLANFLKIDPQLLEALLPEGTASDQALDSTGIDRLKQEILQSRAICTAINESAADARKALVGYLRGEGVFEHAHIALVDTGWRGSSQDAIFSVMLGEKPDVSISGYYYGSSEISEQTFRQNTKYAYQVKPSNRQKIVKMIEVLTVANHGRTLGYKPSATGGYTPCLESGIEHLDDREKEAYFQGIEDFTIRMTAFLKDYPAIQADFMAVDNCLFQELEKGNSFVAECLGDFAFASGAFDEATVPMAPEFSIGEALKYVWTTSKQRNRMTQWFEGTKARSPLLSRAVLALDFRILLRDIARQIVSREQIRTLLRSWR